MSKKQNPLNEAMLAQILHNLRIGDLRRCQAMGLDHELIALIQHPAAASLLVNSSALWCHAAVDAEAVKNLLNSRQRDSEEERLVQRAIRLGATASMLKHFFGLTAQQVAQQRLLLNLPARSGRFAELPESPELWYRFLDLMEEHEGDPSDPYALLDVAMMLTEEINGPLEESEEAPETRERIPLAAVWARIQCWVREGTYPPRHAPARSTLRLLAAPTPPSPPEPLASADSDRAPGSPSPHSVEGDRL